VALSRVSRLLDDSALQKLTGQARHLLALQHIVRASLPAELAALASVGSLTSGRLTLFVDNGAAAAKLRHLAPVLLEKLAGRAPEVTAIQLRVQAGSFGNPLPKKLKTVGPAGGKALKALADRLPNSPLRQAVRRLSRHCLEDEQKAFEKKERYKDQNHK
jgi:hypothetical protein